jgi:hypothetical protein
MKAYASKQYVKGKGPRTATSFGLLDCAVYCVYSSGFSMSQLPPDRLLLPVFLSLKALQQVHTIPELVMCIHVWNATMMRTAPVTLSVHYLLQEHAELANSAGSITRPDSDATMAATPLSTGCLIGSSKRSQYRSSWCLLNPRRLTLALGIASSCATTTRDSGTCSPQLMHQQPPFLYQGNDTQAHAL